MKSSISRTRPMTGRGVYSMSSSDRLRRSSSSLAVLLVPSKVKPSGPVDISRFGRCCSESRTRARFP